MKKYAKIKFVSWKLYTGTSLSQDLDEDDFPYGIGYRGFGEEVRSGKQFALVQCIDISARIAYTKRAIETAYQKVQEDTACGEDTLKVFVAP